MEPYLIISQSASFRISICKLMGLFSVAILFLAKLILASTFSQTLQTIVQNIQVSSGKISFGSNWIASYYPVTNSNYFQLQIKYMNGTQFFVQNGFNKAFTRIFVNGTPYQQFLFSTIDQNGMLQVFKSSNNSIFSPIFTQLITNLFPTHVEYGKSNFIYINYDGADKIIQLSLTNFSLKNLSFPFNDAYLRGFNFNEYLVISGQSKTNQTSLFQLMNENLTNVKKLYIGSPTMSGQRVIYDKNTNITIKINDTYIDVWNMSSSTFLTTIYKTNDPNSSIFGAVICNQILIVVQTSLFVFYELGSWNIMKTHYEAGQFFNFENLKCFPLDNKVCFKVEQGINSIVKCIHYYFVSSNVTPVAPPASLIPEPPNQLYESVKDVIFSKESKAKMNMVANVAGICSASTITQSGIRPFINILQDFWFYRFHQCQYPEFIQIFATQVDILSELRIKPQLLHADIQISALTQQNNRLNSLPTLQERSPQKKFMLESTKQIYTINLLMMLLNFSLLKIICLIMKQIKIQHKVYVQLYKFLYRNSVWWMLMLCYFQNNNAPFIFYCTIQFRLFFYFDFMSKINLIFTIFGFFAFMYYALLFYPLVYAYGKRQSRKKVSDFTQYKYKDCILEMVLKCLHSFLQSLIHGLLINNNKLQLILIGIADIALMIVLLYHRKKFKYNIVFIFVLLYYLVKTVFDLVLLYYFINRSVSEDLPEQKYNILNTIFTIILLLAIAITVLRIVVNFSVSIYQLVKKFIIKNPKIQDENRRVHKIKRLAQLAAVENGSIEKNKSNSLEATGLKKEKKETLKLRVVLKQLKEEIEIGVDKKSRKIKAKKQIQICKVSKTK